MSSTIDYSARSGSDFDFATNTCATGSMNAVFRGKDARAAIDDHIAGATARLSGKYSGEIDRIRSGTEDAILIDLNLNPYSARAGRVSDNAVFRGCPGRC